MVRNIDSIYRTQTLCEKKVFLFPTVYKVALDPRMRSFALILLFASSAFAQTLPANITLGNTSNSSLDINVTLYGYVVTSLCPVGYYCPADTTVPVPCPASTYRDIEGAATVSDCFPCTAGYYCPEASASPTACPASSYRGTPNGAALVDCSLCPPGSYCPSAALTAPILCKAGTFSSVNGSTNCSACATGTFSTTQGLTSECSSCSAGSYCPTVTSIAPCPAHTNSTFGANSQLGCRCLSGYLCSYNKQVDSLITLYGVSYSDFINDVGGVRTEFIASIAAAGGVPPTNVIINGVRVPTRRSDNTVTVRVQIVDSQHLRGLRMLNSHVHYQTKMHQVIAKAIVPAL